MFISLLQIAAEYHLMHNYGLKFNSEIRLKFNLVREWKLREGGLYDRLSRPIFPTHFGTLGIMCFIAMLYVHVAYERIDGSGLKTVSNHREPTV